MNNQELEVKRKWDKHTKKSRMESGWGSIALLFLATAMSVVSCNWTSNCVDCYDEVDPIHVYEVDEGLYVYCESGGYYSKSSNQWICIGEESRVYGTRRGATVDARIDLKEREQNQKEIDQWCDKWAFFGRLGYLTAAWLDLGLMLLWIFLAIKIPRWLALIIYGKDEWFTDEEHEIRKDLTKQGKLNDIDW